MSDTMKIPNLSYITIFHNQNIPNSLSLLLCYTVNIFFFCEQN